MNFVKKHYITTGVILLLLVSIGILLPLSSVYAADYGDWKTWAMVAGCAVGGGILGIFTLGWGLAVGGVCAAGVLGVAQAAISELGAKFLEIVIQPLFQLLVHFARYLVVFTGNMLDTVLSASFNQPAQIVNNNFVVEGWTLVRDFANMFFVLILVLIAFATIFRNETYGVKKTLPRLIIVALLVNFSRVITGVFVDAAQIFMVFFFSSFPETSIGNMLANSMNLAQIGNAHWSELQVGALTEQIVTIIGLIITFFVYILAAFMFGLFAVLFIIRIIALWILIILAPLAFIAAILPITQGYFNTWVNNFTKWTFWGVAAGFFIYLALLLGDALKTMGFGGGNPDSGTIEGIAVAFMRYAALLVFLFIGVNIARTSTDRAGALVSAKFEGAARRAVGLAAAPAGIAAGLAAARARREAERRAAPPARKGAELAASIAAKEHWAGRIPIAGIATRFAARQAVEPLRRFEARVGGQIDAELANAEKFSKEAQLDVAKSTSDPIKRVAYQMSLARRGALKEARIGKPPEHDEFTKEELEETYRTAKRYAREKELAIASPHIAQRAEGWTDDQLKEFLSKIRPSEVSRMSAEALASTSVKKAVTELMQSGKWTPQYLENIVRSDNINLVMSLKNNVVLPFKAAAGDFSDAIEKWLEGPAGRASGLT